MTNSGKLSTDTDMPPEEQLGEKMRALSPRRRLFVWNWITNGGIAQRAVVAAGYSTANNLTIRVKASQLMADERVLAAIHEQSWRMLHSLTPLALAAYQEILMAPGHKDRARVASEVLDRSGFKLPTEIKHTVERTEGASIPREQLDHIRALAVQAGLDPHTLKLIDKPRPRSEEVEDIEIVTEHSTDGIEDLL